MALGLLRLVSGPTAGELCNVCRFQRSFVQRRMRRSVHTRINSQPPGERVSHNTPTPITHVLIAPPPQHCGNKAGCIRVHRAAISWHIALPTPALPMRGSFEPPLQLVPPAIHYFLFKTRRLFNLFQPIQGWEGDRCVSLTCKASHGFRTAQRICDKSDVSRALNNSLPLTGGGVSLRCQWALRNCRSQDTAGWRPAHHRG